MESMRRGIKFITQYVPLSNVSLLTRISENVVYLWYII